MHDIICCCLEMKETYKIDYKILSRGEHKFSFTVDGALFRSLGSEEITNGELTVDVTIEKGASTIQLEMVINGEVEVECDRCLEPFMMPVNCHENAILRVGEQEDEPNDTDIIWVSSTDNELDLRQYIYESILLNLPYQKVHEEGECNPDMLARFSIIDGDEFDGKYPAEADDDDDDDDDDEGDEDDDDDLAGIELEGMTPENIEKLKKIKARL